MANLKLKNPAGGSLNLVSADGASDLTVTFPATTGTAMVSGNMPTFSAYRDTNQSINHNTTTKVQLNTERFDTANCFDSTTNYRFTPNVAGYYQFNMMMSFNTVTSAALTFQPYFYKNGSRYSFDGSPSVQTNSASGWGKLDMTTADVIYLNGSTDYIEMYVYMYDYTSAASKNCGFAYLSGFLARAA